MLTIPEISVASKEEEFDKARKAGKKTFVFSGDGKEENTMKKGESKEQWEASLKKKAPKKKETSKTKKDYSKVPLSKLSETIAKEEGIQYKPDGKSDKERREEIASFVENFNQREGTKFKLTGVKGSGHRKHVHGKSENHVFHGGSDYSMYGGPKKKQDKLLKEMAQAGYRGIDERKVKGSKKSGRGVIHFDKNVKLFGEGKPTSAGKRLTGTGAGEVLLETKSGKYIKHPNIKTQELDFVNEEKKASLARLREAARLAKIKKQGILSGAIDTADKLVSPGLQSEEIMSQGTPAEFEEAPKGMSEDLKNKLAMISTLKPEESKLAKPILDYNMKQEIEAAPKVASTGKVEMKSKKEREEDLINEIASGGLSKEKDSPKKDLVKAQAVAQVEKQSIEELKDPVQQPVQRNKIKQNRPSPKSEFQEAMTFFLPTIIGGLGGALFEGTEGAIAGAEAGTSLGESFRDYKMKKYEMEKGKAKKDYTSFVDIKKGTPVVKHEDGSFTDLQGLPVLPNNITQSVNFRQTRSIEQRQDENNSRDARFDKKFGLDVAKISQLSDAQQQTLASADEVLSSIDRMDELKKNVDTGLVSNAIGSILEIADMAPEGFTELKSTSNDSLAKYVKSISGAQVSEMEAKRLGTIIPTTKDNDETFVRKLAMFKQIVESNKQSFAEAVQKGQPLRKIRGLDEAVKQFQVEGSVPYQRGTKAGSVPSRRQSYQDAIRNAKSVEEIRAVQRQYGVIK